MTGVNMNNRSTRRPSGLLQRSKRHSTCSPRPHSPLHKRPNTSDTWQKDNLKVGATVPIGGTSDKGKASAQPNTSRLSIWAESHPPRGNDDDSSSPVAFRPGSSPAPGPSTGSSRPKSSPRRRPNTASPNPVSLAAGPGRPGSPTIYPASVCPPYQILFPRTYSSTILYDDLQWEAGYSELSMVQHYDPILSTMKSDWVAEEASLAGPPQAENIIHTSFDSGNVGSYPPRSLDMLLFTPARLHKYSLKDLDIEEELSLQPEIDVQPVEGAEEQRLVDVYPKPRTDPVKITLPLDIFDNPDMELRCPSELIEEAHQRGEHGVMARSKFYTNDGKCSWEPCEVIDYDPEGDVYTVEWLMNGRVKNVKRLNLVLEMESEGGFVSRLVAARQLRRRVEYLMRYTAYVETLPFDNPEGVDDHLKDKLLERVGRSLGHGHTEFVEDFMVEWKAAYHRAVKKAVLDFKYIMANEEERNHYIGLQIFPGSEHYTPVPRQGCVPVVYGQNTSFNSLQEKITGTLCVAEEAFLIVLQRFYTEMSITDSALVDPKFGKLPRPWGLEDFRIMQEDYVRDMSESFRNFWMPKVTGVIDELISQVGELPIESRHRLFTLVSRLSLTMSAQLQDVVLISVKKFQVLWQDYFLPRCGKAGTKEIECWPVDSVINPMFKIKLILELDHFSFYPSLETVEKTVLGLLRSMVESVNGIDNPQTKLADVFHMYSSKDMTTIQTDSKEVIVAHHAIQVNF